MEGRKIREGGVSGFKKRIQREMQGKEREK